MARLSTILVATDFSPTSQFALEYAAAQAKMAGAKLLLLHVFELPSLDAGEGMMYAGIEDGSAAEAERKLQALTVGVPDIAVERRLVKGEPSAEILRVAKDEAASQIVVGTHGRSGLLRVLMGSVAERVLRGASCPVVTIKIPEALS
jgi:nucleotide-binding universal stress UspA family protein